MNIPTESSILKWGAIINECENSGMSESSWCREHGIPKSSYFKWKRIVKEARMSVTAPMSQITFTNEARNRYLKTASELGYSAIVMEALRNAKDERECIQILRSARKELNK